MKDKVWFEGEVVQLPRSWRKGRLVTTTFQVRAQEQILTITIFNRPWQRVKLKSNINNTGCISR